MNNRGQSDVAIAAMIVLLVSALLLTIGIWASHRRPHVRAKTWKVEQKHMKVGKLRPSCNDHGKCNGTYLAYDGSDWFYYNYVFQGTDSTSIPTTGWTRGDRPNQEEKEEFEETETESDVAVESESSDSSDSGSDSSDSGGDSGGGDGGGGDGGGD